MRKERNTCGRRDFMKLAGSAGMGLGFSTVGCSQKEKETTGMANSPLAQDFIEVFHNPDNQIYVEGCGLCRMENGTLIAVVPVVPRGVTIKALGRRGIMPCSTKIIRSSDGGKSWQIVSELPYYSAVPWEYKDSLYLFAMLEGTEYRNNDLFLLRSDDEGISWSEPVKLFHGHFWNCHTGMVIRDNKIYWAVCDLALGQRKGKGEERGPRVLTGNLSNDPMDPASWRISEPVPFFGVPEELINPEFRDQPSIYMEPNVIEVAGKIRVISCVKPAKQSTAGLSAVFDVFDDGKNLELRFVQYYPRPGGQLKFCIIWDEVSKMFWSTANLVVDSQNVFDWWSKDDGRLNRGGNDRRFLMLFYGLDGLNWFQVGCIAQANKISQSFMYGTPVIDDNDLIVISRTSINAPDNHDSDYATFHRVKNFRQLAGLKLVPEDESV